MTSTSWPSETAVTLDREARDAAVSAANDRTRINLSWLLRLRWGATVGQAVTILLVQLTELMKMPLLLLAAIMAVEALSNVLLVGWARRRPVVTEQSMVAIMVFDVLALTALLYFTGGPFNPFCFLYLVHIALAAVILDARRTWALAGLSVMCLGLLFLGDVLGEEMDHATHMERMHMHMEGMWVAMIVAAVFIVYFVTRIRSALSERENELEVTRERTVREARLASLASLAAGAAHELATPLSTIAVAAKELARKLEIEATDPDSLEDAQLIRQEVARCREILDLMAADVGQSSGETIESRSIGALVEEALEGLPHRNRVVLHDPERLGQWSAHVPRRSIIQSLRVVLKNAVDATSDGASIEVRGEDRGERGIALIVRDHGRGMPPEVLARVGEPFFSTKGPGAGMGLGLFLTRGVVERIGGSFAIESGEGKGTTVTLTLPKKPPARVAQATANMTPLPLHNVPLASQESSP